MRQWSLLRSPPLSTGTRFIIEIRGSVWFWYEGRIKGTAAVLENYSQSFIVDATRALDITTPLTAISVFDDVAARFIYCQLHCIYSTRVEAGSPGGVGDKLADSSQAFKSAGNVRVCEVPIELITEL